MLVERFARVDQRFVRLPRLWQLLQQCAHGMPPGIAIRFQKQRFDRLLCAMLSSETSPLVIAVIQSALGMFQVTFGLPQPVLVSSRHVDLPQPLSTKIIPLPLSRVNHKTQKVSRTFQVRPTLLIHLRDKRIHERQPLLLDFAPRARQHPRGNLLSTLPIIPDDPLARFGIRRGTKSPRIHRRPQNAERARLIEQIGVAQNAIFQRSIIG